MTGLFYTLGLLMSGFILAGCTAQQSDVIEGTVSGLEITGTPSASGNTTTGSEGVEAKISEVEAKAIALAHSGVSVSDVTFLKCKLELDDGVWEYEVEFYHGDKEYDYDIHAVTGEILSYDFEVETARPSTPSTGGTDSTDKLSEAEAKAIALAHSGLSESDVTFLKCKLELDDGVWEYEVEFYHGDKEYDYDIHAVTGEILSYDFEVETARPSTPSNGGTDSTNITDAEAITIALNHVSMTESQVSQLKCELEKDDGVWEYEIEFKVGKVEYEFTILASDGKILEFEKD